MCFSPQRHAFFWQHSSKSVPRPQLQHFHVQMRFSPTAACNFWFLLWLRTRRFNRPTFRLTPHTKNCKKKAFRDCSNIWRERVFFLLTFVQVHLLPSDFSACLICFSTLHIVGSLLFKLPSTSTTSTTTTTTTTTIIIIIMITTTTTTIWLLLTFLTCFWPVS